MTVASIDWPRGSIGRRSAPRAWLARIGCFVVVVLLCFGPACRSASPAVGEGGPAAASQSAALAGASEAAAPDLVPSAQPLAAPATSPAPAASAVSEGRTSRGLFFEVASATARVHLLGSIHVGRASLYPLNPTIEAAFAGADKLVLEVHLSGLAKYAAAAKLAAAGMYPAGDSLERHISPKLYQQVQLLTRDAGVVVGDPRRMRPWFLALMVTMTELGRLGYDPEQGMDRYFQDRTSDAQEILSLETMDDQLSMFTGLSDRVAELMLRETLEELPSLGQTMDEAYRAWQSGDGQTLAQALNEAMHKPEYRPLYARMFVDRNVKMARAIQGYLDTSGRYFVVVGAGHLVGKQSVVELLRASGHPPVQR